MSKKDDPTVNGPVIPFLTGVLDTSDTGGPGISHQMQRLVDHNEENAPVPNTIVLPENALTANDALGISDANTTDLNEDTVAGEVLNDGYKDPGDTLETPHASDQQASDAVGTSDATSRAKSTRAKK